MGAWGLGILENDLSFEAWDHYLELYERAVAPEEIKKRLHLYNAGDPDPPLDYNTLYWFGLAQAQLDTGHVEEEILEVIEMINEEKIDLDDWHVDEGDREEREAEQAALFIQLRAAFEQQKEENAFLTSSGSSDSLWEKREMLMTRAFFDRRVSKQEQVVAAILSEIEDPDVGDRYRRMRTYDLFRTNFEGWILRYSAGEPLETLKADFPTIIRDLEGYQARNGYEGFDFHNPNQYVIALWLVSLAVLLDVEQGAFQSLVACIGKEGLDHLYDAIVAARLPEQTVKRGSLHPDPFKYLAALPDVAPNQRVVLVRRYLGEWFPNIGKYWFYNLHEQDPRRFFGYWSFELAAMVNIADIDDRIFADEPLYPRDLTGKKLLRTWEDSEAGASDRMAFDALNPVQRSNRESR